MTKSPVFYQTFLENIQFLTHEDAVTLESLASSLLPYLQKRLKTPELASGGGHSVASPHIMPTASFIQNRAGDVSEEEHGHSELKIVYKDRIVYRDNIIEKEIIKPVEIPVEVVRTVEKEVHRVEKIIPPIFSQQARFLEHVLKDAECARFLIGDSTEKEDQLMRLIVRAAQWSKVQAVWRVFERRCLTEGREIFPEELALLEGCLALYNLALEGAPAILDAPEKGAFFHSREQQRFNSHGSVVDKVLMAGLRAPNGEWIGKPLVLLK